MPLDSHGHRPSYGQSHAGQREHAAQIAAALLRPGNDPSLKKPHATSGQGSKGVLICAQSGGDTISTVHAAKLNRPKSTTCKDCGNRCRRAA